jgi:ribosomal protein S12 methylthiotransferase accessory factor YcaO
MKGKKLSETVLTAYIKNLMISFIFKIIFHMALLDCMPIPVVGSSRKRNLGKDIIFITISSLLFIPP